MGSKRVPEDSQDLEEVMQQVQYWSSSLALKGHAFVFHQTKIVFSFCHQALMILSARWMTGWEAGWSMRHSTSFDSVVLSQTA